MFAHLLSADFGLNKKHAVGYEDTIELSRGLNELLDTSPLTSDLLEQHRVLIKSVP